MSFTRSEDIKIEGDRNLGSTIRIVALFEIAPTSVSIVIEDPTGTDQVNEEAMTEVSDSESRVWEYIYQSDETDDEGDYSVFIRATKGTNISFSNSYFTLTDLDDDN